MKRILLLVMLLCSAVHAREFECSDPVDRAHVHVCHDVARQALEIALDMPQRVLSWKRNRFYLDSSHIRVDAPGLAIFQDDRMIMLKDISYDAKGLPYLRVTFYDFWEECKVHLTEDELNNPPIGLYFVLKLYQSGRDEV